MIESKSEERGIFLKWSVFRDKETTLSEKVLFLEINNLSMLDKGCIASNSHFADTLGVKKEAISRLISTLEKKGYITTEIVAGSRNHSRIITINKMLSTDNKMLFRGKQNVNTPLTNCLETKENKTINKTINKTMNKNKGDLDYSFEDYWSLVPNKKNSGQAKATFYKLRKSNILPTSINEMQKGLIYENIKMLFKYKYQQNPSTWLNSENWSQSYTKDTLYDEIASMYSDFEVKMRIKEKIESIFEEYEL